MEKEHLSLGGIPAILWNAPSEKIFLYIHGQGGCKEEAESFSRIAASKNWQVLSLDLPEHGQRKGEEKLFNPWTAVPELRAVFAHLKSKWSIQALCALSIGVWFSLLAFENEDFERSLFIAPLLDMERLIKNMMRGAGVSETRLEKEGIIATDFGQTLSWEYFEYAKGHKIDRWGGKTFILYPENDALIEFDTVRDFAKRFDCNLTIAKEGEHWFHTPPQLEVLHGWLKEHC